MVQEAIAANNWNGLRTLGAGLADKFYENFGLADLNWKMLLKEAIYSNNFFKRTDSRSFIFIRPIFKDHNTVSYFINHVFQYKRPRYEDMKECLL